MINKENILVVFGIYFQEIDAIENVKIVIILLLKDC
jgi:hypothetical protein